MKSYIHSKTGCIYYVINSNVINATNKDDGKIMVLYTKNNNQMFIREKTEFLEKFKEK